MTTCNFFTVGDDGRFTRVIIWIDPVRGEVPELVGMDFSTLFTSAGLIQRNPDLVQRMVNAIAAARSAADHCSRAAPSTEAANASAPRSRSKL